MADTVEFKLTVPLADALPYGILVDGVVYQLDGQPPVAVSQGWGDLKWLYN